MQYRGLTPAVVSAGVRHCCGWWWRWVLVIYLMACLKDWAHDLKCWQHTEADN